MRVYLDMCCFNRPYDDQSQMKVALEAQSKLHIQAMIAAGELDLVGSYTLDYECGNNPYEMRRKAIQQFVKTHMKYYVGPERAALIEEKARPIMLTGIKEKDALHLAAAIYAECAFFISTDKRLLRYQTEEIRLVTPVEFIAETEGD